MPTDRLVRALIRIVAPRDRTLEVEGDLRELFVRASTRRGRLAAYLVVIKELAMIGWWRLTTKNGWHPRRTAPPFLIADHARDVRLALRFLRKTPGYAMAAVVIIGLGVGANTTMFSIVNSLFLTDPPGVAEPEHLVRLARVMNSRLTGAFGYPDYRYFRDQSDVFAGLAGYSTSAIAIAISSGNTTSQADAWAVSGNYFDVLGVGPLVGRMLQPQDDLPGGTTNVAVISNTLWHQLFEGRREAIGSTVRFNGNPFVIVGVVPGEFRGLSPVLQEPDVYVPLHARPTLLPGTAYQLERTNGMLSYWIRVVGRLAPEASVESAQANLAVLNARWPVEFASWIDATGPETLQTALWPLPQYDPNHARRLGRIVWLLVGVVASVLLVAIANLAILQLARASSEQRDIAIRAALGARRIRLVRQLLTESLIVSLAGGILGFVATYWTADAVAALLPFTFNTTFRPDVTVLVVTMGLAASAGILFGLAPAWTITRRNVVDVIRQGGRRAKKSLAREFLVVFQVATSVVLLAAAGVFLQSLRNAHGRDLGFGSRDKLFMQTRLASHGYDEAQALVFMETALEQLGGLPGVSGVTTSSRKPLRTMAFGDFIIDERQERISLGFHRAGPNHFETYEIPIVTGRGITRSDRRGATPAVVINAEAVRKHFDGHDPTGKTLTYEDGIQYTIVGVVANAQYHDIGDGPVPHAYLPFHQSYGSQMTFVLQIERDPWLVATQAQDIFRALDPNVAIFGVESFNDIVRDETGQYRVMAVLVTVFGGLALLLACVGVYGVQSYLVALGRHELCVRMALGARSASVASRVVSKGLRLGVIGAGLGITVAFFGARWFEHMLFGVGGRDPLALTVAPLILLGVLTLASLGPAKRATSLDPIAVLREE